MAAPARRRLNAAARQHQRLDATVRGYVQGVGFRWFVVACARELRLVGWTANESDGAVRVVAEGDPATLDDLQTRLQRGPAAASVETVNAVRMPATGEFETFAIRSGDHRGD